MFSVPRLSARHFLGLALVVCLASLFLTGCDSNPSGSSSGTSTTTTTTTSTPTPSSTSTSTLYGSILDLSTGGQINNINAGVVVRLYKDAVKVAEITATKNNFYSFTDIVGGIYYLEVDDSKDLYYTNSVIVNLPEKSQLQQNVSLKPVPGATTPLSTYTVVGKLLNSVDKTPIMFANVSLGVGGINTSTLEDGTFILYGVTENVYTVTFSKTGFNDFSITLEASATQLLYGTTVTVNGTVTDGAGASVTGKNLGNIFIGPSVQSTGALAGLIENPTTGAIVANTRIALWYKPDRADATRPSVIYRPTTNAVGNLSVENLPPGFYAITALSTTITPVYDAQGNPVAYPFTAGSGDIYTGAYYEVVSGKTTTLVSDGL